MAGGVAVDATAAVAFVVTCWLMLLIDHSTMLQRAACKRSPVPKRLPTKPITSSQPFMACRRRCRSVMLRRSRRSVYAKSMVNIEAKKSMFQYSVESKLFSALSCVAMESILLLASRHASRLLDMTCGDKDRQRAGWWIRSWQPVAPSCRYRAVTRSSSFVSGPPESSGGNLATVSFNSASSCRTLVS